jgi:hypothetical protein
VYGESGEKQESEERREGRGQRTEDRGQNADGRGQRADPRHLFHFEAKHVLELLLKLLLNRQRLWVQITQQAVRRAPRTSCALAGVCE